jgi:hypothetical protein
MNVLTKLMCLLGMHQGTWKTIDEFGCQQSRFCIYCGEHQNREVHNWLQGGIAYFKEGSCETRVACLRCEKTKSTGIWHAGRISRVDNRCKRCGEYLGGD